MDRGGDVPQEHRGVAVARVEPDPGERTRIRLGPPARSVVLPYPAGATTVAKPEGDARSRAIRSGFVTVPGRVAGAASFSSRRSTERSQRPP